MKKLNNIQNNNLTETTMEKNRNNNLCNSNVSDTSDNQEETVSENTDINLEENVNHNPCPQKEKTLKKRGRKKREKAGENTMPNEPNDYYVHKNINKCDSALDVKGTEDTPFNINKYIADTNHTEEEEEDIGNKRVIVGPPPKQDFIYPIPDSAIPVCGIRDEETKDYYIVNQKIVPYIIDEIKHYLLHFAITRKGKYIITPVMVNKNNKPSTHYYKDLQKELTTNYGKWVRLNTDEKFEFKTTAPKTQYDAPDLNGFNRDQIVNDGFKGKTIDSLDHPFLKKLRGEE